MWTPNITGGAVNLRYFATLDIVTYCDGKSSVWAISANGSDRLLAEFDTHEEAEKFIEKLVERMNAPINFPAQVQAMTKNFLDKLAKDKLLFNVSDLTKGE